LSARSGEAQALRQSYGQLGLVFFVKKTKPGQAAMGH
jgi:hypothetical protein